MASKAVRYTPEFKRQMVDLVRSGRTPASLAKEFGPTSWSTSLWVKQDERDAGKGDGGLTSTEREELSRLRRENRKLKEEREILSSRGLVVRPEKVDTFGRGQTCQGNSQKPCSLDSRVEGDRDSEAYRQPSKGWPRVIRL